MADKDVDEQFAAIMAHWDDEAIGLDPFGDPGDPGGPADAEDATDATDATDGQQTAQTPDLGDPRPGGSLGAADDDPGTRAPAVVESDRAATDGRGPTGSSLGSPAAPAPRDVVPPLAPVPPLPPVRIPGSAWREHVPEPEDEHFVPPPPAPLPSADDKHFWLMMVGLIGGPLLFLYLILFNRDGNGWWMVCGIAMTVAGFVLLVLRQPLERDEDDDGVRL